MYNGDLVLVAKKVRAKAEVNLEPISTDTIDQETPMQGLSFPCA